MPILCVVLNVTLNIAKKRIVTQRKFFNARSVQQTFPIPTKMTCPDPLDHEPELMRQRGNIVHSSPCSSLQKIILLLDIKMVRDQPPRIRHKFLPAGVVRERTLRTESKTESCEEQNSDCTSSTNSAKPRLGKLQPRHPALPSCNEEYTGDK